MEIQKISSLKKYAGYLLFFILTACANQLPPNGGPVDLIPPDIIEVYPEDGTTNFKDNLIRLTFSEYVDKSSFKSALFISPKINHLNFNWSGTSVEVIFEDSLENNTTYSVNIGTEVKDLNNGNKMKEPYSFAFSTGKQIDKGIISGKVFGKDKQGAFVFAYKLKDSRPDPTKEKPKYISQVGKTGFFELKGLSIGAYELIALKDKDANMLYSIGVDEYGVPFKPVILTSNDTLVDNVNFLLTTEDTLAPSIDDVVMTDENHLLVKFNEPIIPPYFNTNNCFIIDSTLNKTIAGIATYQKGNNGKEFFLTLNKKLNLGDNLFLIVKNIHDLNNNVLKNESYSFIPSNKKDSEPPGIISINGNDGNKINPLEPKIFINFNDAFDTSRAVEGIKLLDKDSNIVKINIKFIDAAKVIINSHKLKSNSEYYLVIKGKYFIDYANNFRDTTYSRKFKTFNKLDFTGVEGRVISDSTENIVANLKFIDKRNLIYVNRVSKDGTFVFKNTLPGKYILWFFNDSNNDGKYNYGKIKPFRLSEKFIYFPDTLNLRPRWPVGGIEINFN